VQKLLRERGGHDLRAVSDMPPASHDAERPPVDDLPEQEETAGIDVFRLISLRNQLADALKD
jgi:hypothetical protein